MRQDIADSGASSAIEESRSQSQLSHEYFRRFEMWDKTNGSTASIAGAITGIYLFAAVGSCYAAEPADIEPVPLGATLTTGTTGGTTITTSTGIAYMGDAPKMMGDERITVVIQAESLSRVLWPRGSTVTRKPETNLFMRK
jgi:hypothetical protein